MVKKVALTLGALAIAFGSAALVAPAAHADTSAKITGAKATFTASTDVFRLYDTACDGNPVYIKYTVNGGSENRLDFSGGCDEDAKFDKSYSKGTPVRFKVCVDIRPGVDRCSGWSSDSSSS